MLNPPWIASALVLTISGGFAQSPTIRVPVRIVTVPSAVLTSSGQPVRGLQAADFSLLDNDHKEDSRLDFADEPLSLAIAVQTNAAARAWLPQVRRIVSTIEALILGETGDASVSAFGDEVQLIQAFTASSTLLDHAFASLSISGGKNSRGRDAVLSAAKLLEQSSPQRRRIILLIAQSGDQGSQATLGDVLRELERNNIAVYSLAMPRAGKDLVQKTTSIREVKGVFGPTDAGFIANIDLGKLVPQIYAAGRTAAGNDDVSVLTAELGGRRIPFAPSTSWRRASRP